ncbi:MAG: OmpA family protein, partial [Magnetococcales bacterium]|nr:OmpA family protein [Magnetococcales bacterium]
MKRHSRPLVILFTLLFIMICAPLNAADDPNILVVGESGHRHGIATGSQTFKRVRAELVNTLHEEGYDVFDEIAVKPRLRLGSGPHSDSNLVHQGRSIHNPPIDLMVIFQLYATPVRLQSATKIESRVAGRILNVHSGQRMGHFEITSPHNWYGPASCSTTCIREELGKHTRFLAREVGDALAVKLAKIRPTHGRSWREAVPSTQRAHAFSLEFIGFSDDEMMTIEESFAAYPGYRNYKPTAVTPRRHLYAYHAAIGSNKLRRHLYASLKSHDHNTLIEYKGRKFQIRKVDRQINRQQVQHIVDDIMEGGSFSLGDTENNVMFRLNSARLTSGARKVLNHVVTAFTEVPELMDEGIRLDGHTCRQGSSSVNLTLSRQRAQSVRNYLLSRGIEPNRVRIAWYGEERLKYHGSNPNLYYLNRRVDISKIALTGDQKVWRDLNIVRCGSSESRSYSSSGCIPAQAKPVKRSSRSQPSKGRTTRR